MLIKIKSSGSQPSASFSVEEPMAMIERCTLQGLHEGNSERQKMKSNGDEAGRRRMNSVQIVALLTLAFTFFARSAGAQAQASGPGIGEPQKSAEAYRTLYLASAGRGDAEDVLTDLRNMLPKAKLYYIQSQSAISVRGTDEDIQLAQKILSDIDRSAKTYRLTYTITETDGGKQTGKQDFTLVVSSGAKTVLKQGTKIPIVTGTFNEGSSSANSQVQYLDVGLNLEASLEGHGDGLRLRSKIEQSRVAEEKSGVGAQDPMVHQTTLEEISTLTPGKPLMLGSLDIPGTARRQQIEVSSEPVP
jgi:type II secretory pathway component GspD/PulD (secretin)